MPLNIAYRDETALRDRCEIATVRTARHDEVSYEAGAVVPSGVWRSLTQADVESITAPRQTLDSTLVEIVRPPFQEGLPLEQHARPLGSV
ncbi:hypothetical protein ACFVT2_43065 [Streptomyces sp. NPDC058000]|uniref:hypothetical protein n=1 Tax=Streptomyces sp. NPDC058000 TaxID=3346299 RepID=UPI0036E9C073